MPELPEVETVMRGLTPRLEGRILAHVEARRPDLRWPLPVDFARRLTGRRVSRHHVRPGSGELRFSGGLLRP